MCGALPALPHTSQSQAYLQLYNVIFRSTDDTPNTKAHVVTMLNHEIYTKLKVTSDGMVFLPFHKNLFMYQQVQ
jgi:hypothetical protein